MESDLVNNPEGLNAEKSLNMINNFIRNEFPNAQIKKEYTNSSGYWGIEFSHNDILISIESDRGGLECYLLINNAKHPLWQYERSICSANTASGLNIRLILETLKMFFEKKLF